jgi:hypothetical protein
MNVNDEVEKYRNLTLNAERDCEIWRKKYFSVEE